MTINGIIFDMDGLLLDSEPFWKTADLEVYGRLGIDLEKHLNHETTGLRVDAAVQHWFARFPWKGKSLKNIEDEIIDRVGELLREKAVPMRGAKSLVEALSTAKVPLAVCSSSPLSLIETALRAIGLHHFFDVIHSAEKEEYGKPHPAAYLTTAKRMGFAPETLLVFEDSIIGSIAAKAARMKVIAVPEAHYRGSSKFDFCEQSLDSLEDFDLAYFLANRQLSVRTS